jgi:hypothetical protein
MGIYCPQCGVENPPSARFCDQCGAVLIPVPGKSAGGASPAVPAPAASAPQPAYPAPQPVAPTAPAPAPAAPAPGVASAGPSACPQCGTAVIPGEAFCDTCGAALLGPTRPAAPASPAPSLPFGGVPPQPSYPAPQPVAPAAPAYQPPPAPQPIASRPPIVTPPAPAPAPGPAPRAALMPAQLVVLPGGAFVALPAVAQAVVGRSDTVSNFVADVDLTPHDALANGVGRRHARLFVQGPQILVEDLDSTNGTFLNEARLAPRQPAPLKDGDVLRLGNLRLRVEL